MLLRITETQQLCQDGMPMSLRDDVGPYSDAFASEFGLCFHIGSHHGVDGRGAQLCTQYDSGAKLFAHLDHWYLWIKPQYLLQTIAVITVATRSVNLAPQSTKTQVWKGSARTPFHVSSKTSHTHTQLLRRTSTNPWGHLLFWESRPPKTTQRFQKIVTTPADLNAEGFNVQTVNDLLTMYVGAASQNVLRMSFVLEQEAQNFDRQVMTFWSHLMHRDITSPLFFLPFKLGGLGVGSAVQRHSAAPYHSHIDGNNPVTGHRFPLQFNTTTTNSTCTTPNNPLPTNE